MSTLGAVDGVGVHSNYGASAAEMKDGIFIFCVTSTAPIKAISFWISLIRITPVPLRHGVLTTCRPMPALSLGRLKTIAGAKGASRSRRKIITLSYVVGSAVNIVTDWVGCAR